MKRSTKTLMIAGGVTTVAALGVVAYVGTRKKDAASPKGPTPSGIVIPAQIMPGHRYDVLMAADVDQPGLTAPTTQDVQQELDATAPGLFHLVSFNYSETGLRGTMHGVIDYTGISPMTPPAFPAQALATFNAKHASIVVEDRGVTP